jgi:hypothetical protein
MSSTSLYHRLHRADCPPQRALRPFCLFLWPFPGPRVSLAQSFRAFLAQFGWLVRQATQPSAFVFLVKVDTVVGLRRSPCQAFGGLRRGVSVQPHCRAVHTKRVEVVASAVSTVSGPVSMVATASVQVPIDALAVPSRGSQTVGIVAFVVPAIDRVVARVVDEVYDQLVHPVYPVLQIDLALVPLIVDMVQRGLTGKQSVDQRGLTGVQSATLTGVVQIELTSSARPVVPPILAVRSSPFLWFGMISSSSGDSRSDSLLSRSDSSSAPSVMRQSSSTRTDPGGMKTMASDAWDAEAPPVLAESITGAAWVVAAPVALSHFTPASELDFFNASDLSSALIDNL